MSVFKGDAEQDATLTDRWSDEDSRWIAREMVQDMLSSPWFTRFGQESLGKEPAIVIQRIKNKSYEHISLDTFVNDIKRAVITGSMDKIIVSSKEADADFALSGSINSMVDQVDGQRVIFYQVDMKLIDLKAVDEVWSGQKKITKLLKRNRFLF